MKCAFSVHRYQGQINLLGSLLVWYRWDGYGWNEIVDARAVPIRFPM